MGKVTTVKGNHTLKGHILILHNTHLGGSQVYIHVYLKIKYNTIQHNTVSEVMLGSTLGSNLAKLFSLHIATRTSVYTRENAQVVTTLQTSCNKSVHKLSTSCVCTACS